MYKIFVFQKHILVSSKSKMRLTKKDVIANFGVKQVLIAFTGWRSIRDVFVSMVSVPFAIHITLLYCADCPDSCCVTFNMVKLV